MSSSQPHTEPSDISSSSAGTWQARTSDTAVQLGKSLLLGLELLVAADIIETVTLERTMENVLMLAVLVVVRTFLSWSLVVEIEGHWPWKT